MDDYKETINKAKQGNKEAFDKILKRLEPKLRRITSKFYINGSDEQDTLQEARIGVWKAIIDWEETGGMTFDNFAINLCCKRHIITAVSTANRKKYSVLNDSVSLNLPVINGDDDDDQCLSDFISDPQSTSEDQLIDAEEYQLKYQKIRDSLTDLEDIIFVEYIQGLTYNEIADKLYVKTKTVDNALMRIRKKAKEILGIDLDNN
jgi:RNA polymerase sporulation-specific sigma factor